ncbi:hypothetical protein BDB00DRAFT_783654 [Zychaea mexicana]|uniref:uncharacterized protein n=1 Tax=Zychaea mexicana TaxID=64656 RepID=UPI0022FED214|nr:uncharacterized protein BDB00DRAFT_783654 [Zychaea mexicana]KAI9499060.1 hypothetical protein BDB00DRAFT_783654 [Zychaea mexicana]
METVSSSSLRSIIDDALGQGNAKPIKQEDLAKLFESLNKIDTTNTQDKQDIKDLAAMLEATKQEDGSVDEELVRNILGSFLSDSQHVKELSETIGDFEIRF